jgi:hypothetical protein
MTPLCSLVMNMVKKASVYRLALGQQTTVLPEAASKPLLYVHGPTASFTSLHMLRQGHHTVGDRVSPAAVVEEVQLAFSRS